MAYSLFESDGELKIRGIEAHRSDAPDFIQRVQCDLLAQMTQGNTPTELADKIDRLRVGQVPMRDLVMTYHLSRDPETYALNILNAIVERELQGRGVALSAGEPIRYVIPEYDASAPSDCARAYEFLDGTWGYDVERHTEVLMRAVETVLTPLGVNGKMLQDGLAKELPRPILQARVETIKPRACLGAIFEYATAMELGVKRHFT